MIWFKEQWYWCKTCNHAFPASEMSDHQKHVTWPIAG
jgi:hypothetical protein